MSGDSKENQHLACWYDMSDEQMIEWSYTQVDELLQRNPDVIIKHLEMKYDCSPDEANELQEYMQLWRTDVNRQYIA
jgi:RIO-like serine/threonine protein kinase